MNKKITIYKQCITGKEKFIYSLITLLIIITTGMNVYVAIILEKLINIASKSTDIMVLFKYVINMIFYLLILAVISYVLYKLKNKFIYKVLYEYKNRIFNMIINKEIGIFTRHQTSEYVSGLSNDITVIENDYLKNIFKVIEQVVFLVGGIIVMIYLNIWVLIGIMVLFIIPISVTLIFGNKLEPEQEKVSNRSFMFISYLQDTFAGFSDIKLFKAENQIVNVYKKNNNEFEKAKKGRNDMEEKITLFSTVSGSIFIIGVCTIGSILALKGIISIGAVVACIQAVNYIVKPVQELPTALGKMKGAKSLVYKLNELANFEEKEGQTNKIDVTSFGKEIALNNLWFGYEEDISILKGITTVFEKGKSYAVVGASGSGKTTMLNLLLGISNEYKGNILFDDIEIRDINYDSLYRLISIIQQKVFIFNSSVYNNITMYNDFDVEQVTNAINLAGLSRFVEDRGLDYNCGENGCNLSGGERQRISIARSVLQRKPILLMDEVTAALDNKTSYEVESTILRINDLTRIVVTHKLEESILRMYDSILVLKDGKIVEYGTYDELIELKSNFFALKLVSSYEKE